jgi:hypothetical protein
MFREPPNWYDEKADNPPWIKALADVRRMATMEGDQETGRPIKPPAASNSKSTPPKFQPAICFSISGGVGVYQGCHEGPPIWEDEIGGDGSDVFEEAFSGALGLAGFDP